MPPRGPKTTPKTSAAGSPANVRSPAVFKAHNATSPRDMGIAAIQVADPLPRGTETGSMPWMSTAAAPSQIHRARDAHRAPPGRPMKPEPRAAWRSGDRSWSNAANWGTPFPTATVPTGPSSARADVQSIRTLPVIHEGPGTCGSTFAGEFHPPGNWAPRSGWIRAPGASYCPRPGAAARTRLPAPSPAFVYDSPTAAAHGASSGW